MKVKEILEATFTSHLPYNPQSDAGPYNMTTPGNEEISTASAYGEQEEESPKFAIYYDYTGAGRGPEPIAGPFDSQEEANAYAKENEYSLRADSKYFVYAYTEEQEEDGDYCENCDNTGTDPGGHPCDQCERNHNAGDAAYERSRDRDWDEQEESNTGFAVVWHGDKGDQQEAGPFETQQQAKAWYDNNYGGALEPDFSIQRFNPKAAVHFNTHDQEEIDGPRTCGQCNGTGEGQYDGTRCRVCKGSGVIKPDRDDEEPDADYWRDRDQDDRMTGMGRYRDRSNDID